MAHDDEKPETGDDPWAGLESEGTPDLGDEFSFSFEEQVVEADGGDADDAAAAIDAVLDGGLEAEADRLLSSLPDSIPEPLSDGVPDVSSEAPLGEPELRETADSSVGAAAAAEIDDWLSGAADGDAAASSVLGVGAFDDSEDTAGGLPDFMAGDSGVEIGSGKSGIISASGIDAAGDHEPVSAGEDADPFAGLAAEPMDWASAEADTPVDERADGDAVEGEPVDDVTGTLDLTAAVAAGAAAVTSGSGEPKRAAGKTTRAAPSRKKKPSAVGQLVGVVLGGAMAIPITLAILIWGFGKDPFNLTPMLPESLAFLLPQQFRPSAGLPKFPSFDTFPNTPPTPQEETVDDGEEDLPSADNLVGTEPEPPPTDLASTEPAAPVVDEPDAVDPSMDLLDEPALEVTPPVVVAAAPPPEPEPLDLARLGEAIAGAQAALEAVAAVDDPSDPVRRRLLAKWYLSLAGYAEELAAVERLAAETGRPFDPALEQGEAVRAGLAEHPQLLAELSRLTREWIAYAKRSKDGVVMPATFVLAGRVGPYWRSQVTLPATDKLPAREMVVLTRTEPTVAPGDEVVIVGLAVDDDVVWASELRPAAAGAGFPAL